MAVATIYNSWGIPTARYSQLKFADPTLVEIEGIGDEPTLSPSNP